MLYFFLHGVWATEETGGRIYLGRFAHDNLSGWNEKIFDGRTSYSIVNEPDGKGVLKAHTRGKASGLFRKTAINLVQTPFLNWSWKVDRLYSELDEHVRSGDDYPARVYVVFSGGPFFWRTRALNYVWSSSGEKGSSWPNAYTSNAHMIAVRARDDGTGVWYTEKRNIREDFKRYFGEDITEADGVAIMTDGDQSGQETTAWYGDLYLSSK